MKNNFFISRIMLCALLSSGVSYGATAHKTALKQEDASKVAPMTLSGAYGAWSYRCAFAGESLSTGPQSCVIQQTLMARNGNQGAAPIGMVIIARTASESHKDGLSDRPWRLTVMAPLGLSIKKQPLISIDGGKESIGLEWQSCVATGCLASADLKPAQAKLLRDGSHKGAFVAEKVLKGSLTIDFAFDGADKSMKKIDKWISHSPLK